MKKKDWIIALVVVLLAAVLGGCGQKETAVADLTYELIDGEVTITGYTGTERNLVIPKEIEKRPVTRIGEYAFAGYDMTSIELPETLVEIGPYAFTECDCLLEIEIPEKMETIGEGAFYHCDVLARVVLPNELRQIDTGAFNSCVVLDSVNIPKNLEYLGAYSFGYCDKLLKNRCNKRATSFTCDYFWIDGADMRNGYEESYDAHGYPTQRTTISDGSRYTTIYENRYESNSLVERKGYDNNGELKFVMMITYDENGMKESQTTIAVDGSQSIVEFDEQGQTKSYRAYDEEGELLADISYVYFYNNFGLTGFKTIDMLYGETTSQYLCNEYGEIIERISYNEDGEETERASYMRDEDGNLLEITTLYTRWTKTEKSIYFYD